MSNWEFERETIEGVPAPSVDHVNSQLSPPDGGNMVRMVQEVGANLTKFILRAAVSSTDARGKTPKVSKVREWQYRDLMGLPKAVQEEWKTACKGELETLHWCNIFKLTDLPKGCKTMG